MRHLRRCGLIVVSLSSSFDGSLTFATEAETHLICGVEHSFKAEATWSCEDCRAAIVIVHRAAADATAAAPADQDLDLPDNPADDNDGTVSGNEEEALLAGPAVVAGGSSDGHQGASGVEPLPAGLPAAPPMNTWPSARCGPSKDEAGWRSTGFIPCGLQHCLWPQLVPAPGQCCSNACWMQLSPFSAACQSHLRNLWTQKP